MKFRDEQRLFDGLLSLPFLRMLFGGALNAAAAFRIDVFLPIFFTIIVEEFFAQCNLPRGLDPDMTVDHITFGVGTAGMINIARCIETRGAINIHVLIDVENVEVTFIILRLVNNDSADIFNDLLPLRDRLHSKKPESGSGTSHSELVLCVSICP